MNSNQSNFLTSREAEPQAPLVFVVDNDVSIHESLEPVFREAGCQPEIFASAEEFLARPRVLTPSCLVLGVNLPGLGSLDLQQLLADRVELQIVFITDYGDTPTTVRAMKAGAVEVLTKPICHRALSCAIAHALERSHAALVQEAQMRALRDRYASLSRREQEVLALVISGRLNKQIARELNISEHTVKSHRGRMMRKMLAGSLADLVATATRLGLTPSQRRCACIHPTNCTGTMTA